MTAIAWAIIFYAIATDKSLKTANKDIQNFAYSLATIGIVIVIILTIKEIFK